MVATTSSSVGERAETSADNCEENTRVRRDHSLERQTRAATTRRADHGFPPDNDRMAWDRVMSCFRERVTNWARRLGQQHADANDTAQTVCLKIWCHRDKVGHIRSWDSWLFRCTTNAISDARRRAAHRRESHQAERFDRLPCCDMSPLENAEQEEARETLASFVQTQSETDRLLWQLRDERYLTTVQIADETKKPAGTVRRRLCLITKRVRSAFFARERERTA